MTDIWPDIHQKIYIKTRERKNTQENNLSLKINELHFQSFDLNHTRVDTCLTINEK